MECIRLPGVFRRVARAERQRSVEIDCHPRQNPAYRSGRIIKSGIFHRFRFIITKIPLNVLLICIQGDIY